eukprot:4159530-Amphidinium_carterae.1
MHTSFRWVVLPLTSPLRVRVFLRCRVVVASGDSMRLSDTQLHCFTANLLALTERAVPSKNPSMEEPPVPIAAETSSLPVETLCHRQKSSHARLSPGGGL